MEYSLAQAIRVLFKFELSKYKNIKDSIGTLEGKKEGGGVLDLIRYPPKPGEKYGRRSYSEAHLSLLHNVFLLQAFFPKPASIRAILEKPKNRYDQVQYLIEAIGERCEVGGILFDRKALQQFLYELKTEFPFKKEKLSNPFIELPQLNEMSVVSALKHEGAYAKDIMSMMDYYLSNDIRRAYDIAKTLDGVTGTAAKYKTMVENRFKDANNLYEKFNVAKKIKISL